jgi:hypothetical protein
MNVERFVNWVAAVRQLTREQRRQAWMMLALEEAEADEGLAAAEACAGIAEPALIAVLQSPELDSKEGARAPLAACVDTADALIVAAQSRAGRLGCPHCDAKDVRR